MMGPVGGTAGGPCVLGSFRALLPYRDDQQGNGSLGPTRAQRRALRPTLDPRSVPRIESTMEPDLEAGRLWL